MIKKYFLDCKPIPLARARHTERRVWDSQKQIKFNCSLALQNQHGNSPLFKGPLKLDVQFYFPIPKTWSKKKKDGILDTPHIYKPDVDNLVKFICDVGNKILYEDDCIFAEINAKKLYGVTGKTVFTITELVQ